MRPRTKSSARPGAMSCPSRCAPRRGGGSSSARPASRRTASKSAPSRTASARRRRPTKCRWSSKRTTSSGAGAGDGTRGCREGKRRLEQHRWENPDSIPRGRPARLLLAAERLESDRDVECRSNAAYEHYRATARDRLGRRLSRPPNPYEPRDLPAGKVNVTDPDSRPIPIGFGFVQGYNAQAAVNE